MKRMKTFFMYALWVVLFFIFSEVLIYVGLNTMHKEKEVEIKSSQIKNVEATASSISGTVKGKINNGNNGKYININCYSKRNVLMGSKYIEITNNEDNKENDFEIKFNFNRVDKIEVDVVDEIPEEIPEESKLSDPEMSVAMAISALILLFYFG